MKYTLLLRTWSHRLLDWLIARLRPRLSILVRGQRGWAKLVILYLLMLEIVISLHLLLHVAY
jgi:hypothetical protein